MQLKSITVLLLVSLISLVSTGCGTVKKINIPKQNIQRVMGDKDVARAITTALKKQKWHYKEEPKSKTIVASIHKSGWDLKIAIDYSKNSYSVNYNSSHNLKYDAESNTIHPIYNVFVSQLNRQLQYELQRVKVVKEEKGEEQRESRAQFVPHNTSSQVSAEKKAMKIAQKREEIITPVEIW